MESKLESFGDLGRWRSFRKKDEISAILLEVSRDLRNSIAQFQVSRLSYPAIMRAHTALKVEGQISIEFQVWEMAAGRM